MEDENAYGDEEMLLNDGGEGGDMQDFVGGGDAEEQYFYN